MKDDAITFNDFFQLKPYTYRAADLVAINHLKQIRNKDGVLEDRPHYKVLFSDGREWNTDNNMIGGRYETYTAMVKQLSRASGVAIKNFGPENL